VNAAQRRRLALYGLSEEDFLTLLRHQDFGCALCLRPFTEVRVAHIEHDHQTGLAYGLADYRCNHDLLGVFGRDPAFYRRIADYLESPPVSRLPGPPRRHRDAPPSP
jgi:recombination endonuclease VII